MKLLVAEVGHRPISSESRQAARGRTNVIMASAASAATGAVKRKIVVAGGNGFLGTRICKYAAARGWDVVSLR